MRYILIAVLIIILIVFIFTSSVTKNFKSLIGNLPKFTSTSSFLFSPPNYTFYSGWGSTSETSTFSNYKTSSYFKKVRIESIKNLVDYQPKYEEISLVADGISDKVDITGWSLVSNKNNFVITFGIKNLDFSKSFQESNIVLKKGDRVKIYSTYSPLGVNFALNKCSGYLNNGYFFVPPLEKNCPRPEKRDIAHLSGICQEYILKLDSCEIPKLFQINNSDPACLGYLNKINYQGCFEKYKNASDFYTKEWRIFMGREILDDLHDKVLLFDRNGLLVDEYIY